jgi:hypothetical protein
MITEPLTDGQTRPLQEFETLYIGVATPAVRRGFVGYTTGPNQDYAR